MMAVSENTLKWLMRLYPPLFFQRIWVREFSKGFKGVKVKINKSLLNKNYNGSIFGGTIFAAADPFFPILFNQTLNLNGKKRLKIWSKSSKIDFLKPGLTDLFFEIKLTDTDIERVLETLTIVGKYEGCFPVDIYNKNDEICVSLLIEVYVRDLDFVKALI
jgi:acyl-coenzyme A thioesterase PaaI-like protein